MSNGHHRTYGRLFREYTPKKYDPTPEEKFILDSLFLSKKDKSKMNRQNVYLNGVKIGIIQTGFGFDESYTYKTVFGKVQKRYLSFDECILNLYKLYRKNEQ